MIKGIAPCLKIHIMPDIFKSETLSNHPGPFKKDPKDRIGRAFYSSFL